MVILACDTSSAACSACLCEDGRVVASSFLSLGLMHSQTFMPLVDDLVKRAGYSYERIDAFASTVGPGSFTGIRIGVSAVKTMAMMRGKPAVPVSSLEALAFPFFRQENTLVLPLIDARNRRVFAAGYWGGEGVISERACAWEDVLDEVRKFLSDKGAARVLLCGNAGDVYAKEISVKERSSFTREFALSDDGGRRNRSEAPNAQASHCGGKNDIENIGLSVILPHMDCAEIDGRSVAAMAYRSLGTVEESRWMDVFAPAALSPEYRAKTAAERARETQS